MLRGPFWPYFAGVFLLLIGLPAIIRRELPQAQGMDKAVVFGRLFFAVPMAVFGADHFVFSRTISALVPSWIPGPMFWTYLVGAALILAALSIVTRQHSALAAKLLSAMIFSFVLLIHVPAFVRNPSNRIAFVIVLRDLSFSGGAMAYAVAQAKEWPKHALNKITTLLRWVIAVPAVVFGVEYFLHPELVPIVPLRLVMPSWIPGHSFLNYSTGALLIACGLAIVFNWRSRLAATWLGIVVFVTVVLVYLPITIAKISDIANGLNYLADTLAFSGNALLLAGALPRGEHQDGGRDLYYASATR